MKRIYKLLISSMVIITCLGLIREPVIVFAENTYANVSEGTKVQESASIQIKDYDTVSVASDYKGNTKLNNLLKGIIIGGCVLIALVVVLSVINGKKAPNQFKKDWKGERRRIEKEQERKEIEEAIRKYEEELEKKNESSLKD